MRLLDQLRRDTGKLHTPRVIADGITVHADGVWAWVILPTRSTDELGSEDLFALTGDAASALRRLIPTTTEFHFKLQWGTWDGADYVDEEAATIRGGLTAGQREYLELGGRRIAHNAFFKRQVLLGIRLVSASNDLPAVLRRQADVGGEDGEFDDAAAALNKSLHAADTWHRRMAASTFAARPATVRELAWSLRRDLQRTVDWLPEGPVASGGQVARLINGGRAVPHLDHVAITSGKSTSYVRVLAAATTGFPVAEMELPGSEWLKELTLVDSNDRQVPVEVSIRGRNLSSKDALKRMREALSLAKEQRREAATGIAEEAPEAVEQARAVLPERIKEVQQGLVGMVADNVSWIVEAPSLAQLNERTATVIDHYGDQGITLWEPQGVQDVLYRETILGDRLRFTDCEQFRPWTTLVGGWFHGGSQAGSTVGPMLGAIVGSTPGPYRNRLTNAAIEGDPVTTVFVGRSGAGKSTGVLLSVLPEVVYGGWGCITDQKGDLAGIVPLAESFGVKVTTVSTAEQASGSMDPFRYVPDPLEAASRAADNLMQMLPQSTARTAEAQIRRATTTIAELENPNERSTWAAIRELQRSQDVHTSNLGDDLADLARDPLARAVAGHPSVHGGTLPTGPGLVYMRFNDLRMPSPESHPDTWTPGQRLSTMLMQAGYAYATYMASRVKGIPKVVALTELHLITPFAFGRAFVGGLARLGRALDVSLLLDTQAVAELLTVEGLLDQVTTVYAFRVKTDAEADAQAVLLGLTPEPKIRARQQSWPRGHCLVRDRWNQLAPMVFDYLSTEIMLALDTNPERSRDEELADFEDLVEASA